MVFDSSRVAHTRSADDHLGLLNKVDRFRILCSDRQVQIRETDRIDLFCQKIQRFFIIALLPALVEDLRRLHCQRTVHIDREVREIRHHVSLFDMADVVEHDLGPADREGGDHDVSASVESLGDDIRQILYHICVVFLMDPVTIGGFHDHIVCFRCIFRVFKERLHLISDVTGKYDLLLRISLLQPQLDTRRSQKMAYVSKAEADPVTHREYLVIGIFHEQFDRFYGILHSIDRLISLSVDLSLCLLVAPLRLHLLDVRRILEHDIAETGRRSGRNDLPPESVAIQFGKHSGVVNMRVRQKDKVYFRRGNRHIRVLKPVDPLFHAAVDQEFLLADLQIVTASRHLVISAQKH